MQATNPAEPLAAGLFTTAPPEVPAASSPAARLAAKGPRRLCAPPAGGAGTGPWHCRNWAGTVQWAPQQVVLPESEDALSDFLKSEAASGDAAARRPFRVVGFAHSWSSIYVPASSGTTAAAAAKDAAAGSGITVALHRLRGVTQIIPPPAGASSSAGPAIGYVEALAGTSFAELFEALDAKGLALLVPPGGIQGLTVGGAVSVGFHGSQVRASAGSRGCVDWRGGVPLQSTVEPLWRNPLPHLLLCLPPSPPCRPSPPLAAPAVHPRRRQQRRRSAARCRRRRPRP
jgi:hypothetical protein